MTWCSPSQQAGQTSVSVDVWPGSVQIKNRRYGIGRFTIINNNLTDHVLIEGKRGLYIMYLQLKNLVSNAAILKAV